METIKEVLMRRDDMSEDDADDLIEDALDDLRQRLDKSEPVDDICEEFFGLEPDFLEELIGRV